MAKINLRPLKEGDQKLFYVWWNDAEIRKLTSAELEPIIEKEIDKTIAQHLADKNGTDFIIEADAKPIGHILIQKDGRKKYYALYIAIGEKDYWDKGYGTEALKQTCAWFWKNYPDEQIIELEVNTNNPRALRCYEKVGFQKISEKHYQKSPDTFLMRLNK